MTKIFRTFIFATALMIMSQATAFAGAQDFILVNNTDLPIYHVYCSRANAGTWEEDILGATGVLMEGESVRISFDAAQRGRYWDLRLVFNNGVDVYWEDVDLLTYSVITVNNDCTASFE